MPAFRLCRRTPSLTGRGRSSWCRAEKHELGRTLRAWPYRTLLRRHSHSEYSSQTPILHRPRHGFHSRNQNPASHGLTPCRRQTISGNLSRWLRASASCPVRDCPFGRFPSSIRSPNICEEPISKAKSTGTPVPKGIDFTGRVCVLNRTSKPT